VRETARIACRVAALCDIWSVCLGRLYWAVVLVLLVLITFLSNARLARAPPTAAESLIILVSGDTQGLLFPCGCAAGQPGGLARRATIARERPIAGPAIYADLGNAPGGESPYDLVKFAAILHGEIAMGVVAHNLGPAELRLGTDELHRLARELKAPFVSTNVRDAEGRPVAELLRVVEMPDGESLLPVCCRRNIPTKRSRCSTPADALEQALADQAPRYDALLVLAYLPADELAAFAGRLPENALLVGPSHARPAADAQRNIAGTVGRDGRSLVLIEFGKNVSRWTANEVVVAASQPEEPAQVNNLWAYHEELAKYDFAPQKTGFSMPLPARSRKYPASCRNSDLPRLPCAGVRRLGFNAACTRMAVALESRRLLRCRLPALPHDRVWMGRRLPRGRREQRRPCRWAARAVTALRLPMRLRRAFARRWRPPSSAIHCHDADNSPGFDYSAAWNQIHHGISPAGRAAPGSPLEGTRWYAESAVWGCQLSRRAAIQSGECG